MNKSTKWVLLFSALTGFSEAALSLPAFPGAEGFGSEALGGRGGKVIEVTNLNDSGAGSLRAALTASGPRIVVFRTGGTIKLLSEIKISNPYLTVAGQSAPGGGISIRNDSTNIKTPLHILTHDVVIRYIRTRPGPSPTTLTGDLDALDIDSGYNIVVDHCSFSWATDEVLTFGWSGSLPRPHDVTIQWSIVSEALNHSTQIGGEPGKGLHINEGNNNISLHHNLLAQNLERNPRIKTNGLVDIVNNVIYNPEFHGSWGPSHSSPAYGAGKNMLNYVGNYYKPGVNSGAASYYVSADGPADIFLQGNVVPHDAISASDASWVVGTRHPAAPLTPMTAQDAYQQVLDKVGASLPVRDAVDQRVVNDVRNGAGKIIDNPAQVGGWPTLAAGTPPVDSDHDGMPDDWELANGLNPMSATDGSQDADNDGYTNVEEYLNGTTSTPAPVPTPVPTPTPTPVPVPTPVPTPTASVLTFSPSADATIASGSATTNYGSATTLEADNSPVKDFLIKFTVAGTSSRPVLKAKLRLYNVNSSSNGGKFYRAADTAWTESGVNWKNAPAAYATSFASLGTVASGKWYEVDVTSFVTKDGAYSLRVKVPSSDAAHYNSKEVAKFAPQLVVTLGQ